MNENIPTVAPVKSAAATMDQFFTRSRANEGVELDLTLPDGTPTEHKLRIRGVDSDAFKTADAETQRFLFDQRLDQNPEKLNALMLDSKVKVISSLIISWTFPQECTRENISVFLREAPQIMDQIDRLAHRRALFYKAGLPNSTPSPAPSSI